MRVTHMNSGGRLTLPVEVRRQLEIEGECHFRCDLHDGIVWLTPVRPMSRRLSSELRAKIAAARTSGRTVELSVDEVAALLDEPVLQGAT